MKIEEIFDDETTTKPQKPSTAQVKSANDVDMEIDDDIRKKVANLKMSDLDELEKTAVPTALESQALDRVLQDAEKLAEIGVVDDKIDVTAICHFQFDAEVDPDIKRYYLTSAKEEEAEEEGVAHKKRKSVPDFRPSAVTILLSVLNVIQVRANATVHDKNIISISLNDMKTVHMILNMVVVEGLYGGLDPSLRADLEKRTRLRPSTTEQDSILAEITYNGISELINDGGDVGGLILRAGYYGDVFLLASTLKKEDFMDKIDTYQLYSILTRLAKNHPLVTSTLSTLPMRPDGVASFIDFVLSSGDSSKNMLMEKVIQVLTAVPKGISPRDFFQSIFGQIRHILTLASDTDSSKFVVDFVSKLYDMPKFHKIVQFEINNDILKIFRPSREQIDPVPLDHVIVSSAELEQGLITLYNLLRVEQPTTDIMEKISTNLWYYAYSEHRQKLQPRMYRFLAEYISKQRLVTVDNTLRQIYNNLGQTGIYGTDFHADGNGRLELRRVAEVSSSPMSILSEVDDRVSLFVRLLGEAKNPEVVSNMFTETLVRYLEHSQTDNGDPIGQLINAKLMEGLMMGHKGLIAKSPEKIVELVIKLLEGYEKQKPPVYDDSDDDMADSDDEMEEEETMVKSSLDILSALALEDANVSDAIPVVEELMKRDPSLKQTCQAFLDSVKQSQTSEFSMKQVMDMIDDSMIPIRAQGLQKLIWAIKGDHVTLSQVLPILVKNLADDDSYIYLNCVKMVEICIEKFPEGLETFADIYADKKVAEQVRLKLGEGLAKAIERLAADRRYVNILAPKLFQILRPDNQYENEVRISALSLVSILCERNEGLYTSEGDAFDVALGVLTHEHGDIDVRRAAARLLVTLTMYMNGNHWQQIKTQAQYVFDNDTDDIVKGYCKEILEYISHATEGQGSV
ncbi:Transport and Golgi organization protein 6-like protein [Yarrowia sp. C11]|nr:Transport and Golgi organization protein 6-like protein [Yarrowia sp. C11]